jgi:hypothetical protein
MADFSTVAQGLGGLCPALGDKPPESRVPFHPRRAKIHGRRRCLEAIEWRRFEAPRQVASPSIVRPCCLDVRREKGSIQSTFVAAHAIKSAKPSARGMCVSEEDTFHGWCGRIETLLAHCARGPRFEESLSGVKHLLHPSPSTISSAFQYRRTYGEIPLEEDDVRRCCTLEKEPKAACDALIVPVAKDLEAFLPVWGAVKLTCPGTVTWLDVLDEQNPFIGSHEQSAVAPSGICCANLRRQEREIVFRGGRLLVVKESHVA